jgi:hypothetical protein
MEVLLTERDLLTIDWIEKQLRDKCSAKSGFAPMEEEEDLHNALGFLHKIKTNAISVKKLQGK